MAPPQAISMPCAVCKSPSMEVTRNSFCSTCFNRNLERACHSTAVADGPLRTGSGLRTFFPGMPRAVLVPAKVGQDVTMATSSRQRRAVSASPANGVDACNLKLEALSSRHIISNDKQRRDESADGNGANSRTSSGERQEHMKVDQRSPLTQKMHFFKTQKNLTVEIPKLPTEMSPRRPRLQPLPAAPKRHSYTSMPAYQLRETSLQHTMQASKVKKWTVKHDPTAEAQLMMRLLADSVPILKSTAPLVLPPCKVRPAPVSPVSPPGDPLWKRRCIPCPKSLKVQPLPVCVG